MQLIIQPLLDLLVSQMGRDWHSEWNLYFTHRLFPSHESTHSPLIDSVVLITSASGRSKEYDVCDERKANVHAYLLDKNMDAEEVASLMAI